jgi:bilirubin oxidase
VNLTRLKLAPGERAEILVNLQGLLGQTIQLMSYGSQLQSGTYGAAQPGMGPGQSIPNYTLNPLNGANFTILKINVIPGLPNGIVSIPNSLVANSPWPESTSNASKTLTFSPQNMGPTAIVGPFFINNTLFNMDVINYQIPLNNVEVWTLQNNTPIAHPFHLHNVPFYILDINGVAPPPELAGRKDVVLVPGGQGTVRFITKFEDFANPDVPYMYHCHMLTHEDGGMMGQFIVYDPESFIEEAEEDAFQLYPNPTSEILYIESTEKIETLTIYSLDGKNKLSIQNPTSNEINISHLEVGIYLIECKLDNRKALRKKIIKL